MVRLKSKSLNFTFFIFFIFQFQHGAVKVITFNRVAR